MKTHEIIKHRRHRQANSSSSQAPTVRIFRNLAIAAVILLAGAAAAIIISYALISRSLPAIENVRLAFDEIHQPTIVTDRNDEHALLVLSNDMLNAEKLAIGESGKKGFSQNLINTVVASRQPDFWTSSGAALKEGVASLFSGEPETIAEELVAQAFPNKLGSGLRKSVLMKILAMQITERYTPRTILTWYLNTAYFGQLSFGADSAARTYLNRSAVDLTLAESIFLSAILNAPALNPIDSQGAMKQSYLGEVKKLEESGYLSPEQVAEVAATNFVIFEPPQLRAELQTNPAVYSALWETYQELGQETVERGGYRIRTTLDYQLQRYLECLLTAVPAEATGENTGTGEAAEEPAPVLATRESCVLSPTTPLETDEAAKILDTLRSAPVSAIVLDIGSGEMLAAMEMSIGASGIRSPMNRFSGHEPGTLVAPFIALAGLSQRISPSTLVWDTAENRFSLPSDYQNPDGKFHGPISLRTAINEDYLGPITALAGKLGTNAVVTRFGQFGLDSLSQYSPESLLLDSAAVTIDRMAMAYIPFAAGEVHGSGGAAYPAPQTIFDIRSPLGDTIDAGESVQLSVLDENLAYMMTNLLSEGDQSFRYLDRPAGVKIGRIYQKDSVWVIGYTPETLAAVYIGESANEENDQEQNLKAALALWQSLMQQVSADQPATDWNRPQQVLRLNVCVPSGKLPNPTCPETGAEVFLRGSEPLESDDLYVAVPINQETQRLATVMTPFNLIQDAVYLQVPPFAEKWALDNGISRIPTEYDTIQPDSGAEIDIYQPAAFASYTREQTGLTIEVKAELAISEPIRTVQVSLGTGLNPGHWREVVLAEGLENGRWTLAELNADTIPDGLQVIRITVVSESSKVYRAHQFFSLSASK